jgi:hypothetical protein
LICPDRSGTTDHQRSQQAHPRVAIINDRLVWGVIQNNLPALLKQCNPRSGYSTREIDDIANLAFIGGRANRRISDKSPADYIPELIAANGEQAFASQCIPTRQTKTTPAA